ncbi:lymphocyte antigen 6G6e-like [Saimiri boliviensis]|uniref:lymphocyte antigen 6G6e-like n=1 Tax=Saimiri boliviensis TaxID=27679 RepID=UPI003D772ED1
MLQLCRSRDLRVQITSPRFLSLGLAMGTSSIFLCILFLCGTLGLTMAPAQGRLRCYTCGFAKPCYPVPTECQDDDACGISIGTSGRTLVQWPFWRLPTSIHPTFPVAPTSVCLLRPTDQSEIIQLKGCLPKAQCPLLGHATYWLHSYTLRHHCCEQDLCNGAASPRQLPSLLTSLPLLVASFTGRGPLLH